MNELFNRLLREYKEEEIFIEFLKKLRSDLDSVMKHQSEALAELSALNLKGKELHVQVHKLETQKNG